MSAVRVAAVVPTLDRRELLERCLASLRAQTRPPDEIVVVDNGSADGSRGLITAARDVTAILPHANLGAPGGFQAGIESARGAGADLVWLMDDDATADPYALARMLARLEAAPARTGGVVPTVAFDDGTAQAGWLWGERASAGRGQSPNTVGAPDADWGPFAGLLLDAGACSEVGPVRADFRLWHADVEYCLRLRRAGFALVTAPDAVVRHPAMPLVSREVLGRRLAVGGIAPWREYYDARNGVLLRRALRGSEFEDGMMPWHRAGFELRRAAAVLAADPGGPRRVAWRLLGGIDGLRGKLDRRPELGGS